MPPAAETPLYASIVEEVLAGLPNERDRRDEALDNLKFYRLDFSAFPVREAQGSGDSNRFVRTSPFMRRVVESQSALLYKQAPRRDLPDHPEAATWLAEIYRKNNADALLQEADRLTHVTDFAAIQAEPSPDPDCPVRLRLWDGSKLYYWECPDEPTRADAVATLDVYDHRRRLRLWTAASCTTFLTAKWDETTRTAGGTAYEQQGSPVPNTLGVLPFAFVRHAIATTEFCPPGPGRLYRDANHWINKRLTDEFDCCRYNLNPIILLKAVRPGYQPPSPTRPGDVWNLPPDDSDESDVRPGAEYLQADSSFVAAGWDDLQSGIDHVLEMSGVPPSSVRLAQPTAASGDSLVAEQIEPVKYAEGRQRKAALEEDDLVVLVLTVGSAHLGAQDFAGYRATATQLEAAARSPGLVLHWPSYYPRVPGQSADVSDQWLLDNALVSRTQLVMERLKLTEEEAEAYLEQVAEHLKREGKLFEEAKPAADPETKTKGARAAGDLDETDESTTEPESDEI